jgi:hypothetical protein
MGGKPDPTESSLSMFQFYATMVSTSACNHMDSWYFYKAIYVSSIGYVLPNCFFSKKELKVDTTGIPTASLSLSQSDLEAVDSYPYIFFKAKTKFFYS